MKQDATLKMQPHNFVKARGLPWPVCKSCGLVRLRNEFTDWCVRYGCNHEEHPGYRAALRSLSKPKDAVVIDVEPYAMPALGKLSREAT